VFISYRLKDGEIKYINPTMSGLNNKGFDGKDKFDKVRSEGHLGVNNYDTNSQTQGVEEMEDVYNDPDRF